MSNPAIFYRYHIERDFEGFSEDPVKSVLVLSEFKLHKPTACGYWIQLATKYEYKSLDDSNPRKVLGNSYYPPKKKWIAKNAKRPYACITKEQAWEVFVKRTRKRMGFIKAEYAFVLEAWLEFCYPTEGTLRHRDDEFYFMDTRIHGYSELIRIKK